jgi:citrate lyase beta subunit
MTPIRYQCSPPNDGTARIVVTGHMIDRTILREWRQFIERPEPSPGEQGGTAALGQQARS